MISEAAAQWVLVYILGYLIVIAILTSSQSPVVVTWGKAGRLFFTWWIFLPIGVYLATRERIKRRFKA